MSYNRIKFRKINKVEVIGVMGTEHMAGATHFSCMLGVFLAIVKGYKVAVVELNSPGSIRQVGAITRNLGIRRMNSLFKIIALHTEADEIELSNIISAEYDYVIVDYGSNFEKYKKSYLMCPYKIVVGNLSWWRIHNYVSFVGRNYVQGSSKHWFFMATSPVTDGIRYMNNRFKIHIEEVPYEPDPFLLKNSLGFLHKITEKLF